LYEAVRWYIALYNSKHPWDMPMSTMRNVSSFMSVRLIKRMSAPRRSGRVQTGCSPRTLRMSDRSVNVSFKNPLVLYGKLM